MKSQSFFTLDLVLMQRCFCETLCCLPWDFCSPDRLSTLWCQAKVGLRVLYIVVSSGAKPISDPIYMAVNPTPPPQLRDRYVWNNLGTLVASWRMGQFIFGLGTASRFFVTKSRLEEKRSRESWLHFAAWHSESWIRARAQWSRVLRWACAISQLMGHSENGRED